NYYHNFSAERQNTAIRLLCHGGRRVPPLPSTGTGGNVCAISALRRIPLIGSHRKICAQKAHTRSPRATINALWRIPIVTRRGIAGDATRVTNSSGRLSLRNLDNARCG